MRKDYPPLHQGAAPTETHIKRILNGLRDCSLPKREWTHGAHLTAAAALLDAVGLDASEQQMPGLIRAYNEATGVANTDSEGYHHTLTLFFLKKIDCCLAPHKTAPLTIRTAELLSSPLALRDYPLQFYSKELLFSVKARRGWKAPDLKPMDAD